MAKDWFDLFDNSRGYTWGQVKRELTWLADHRQGISSGVTDKKRYYWAEPEED